MSDFNKMAVIGKKEFVQIFGAVGFDVFETLPNNWRDYGLVVETGGTVQTSQPETPYPIILNLGELV